VHLEVVPAKRRHRVTVHVYMVQGVRIVGALQGVDYMLEMLGVDYGDQATHDPETCDENMLQTSIIERQCSGRVKISHETRKAERV
jgi:hypothetical protein